MSSITRSVRSTWWLAVLGLAAVLTQPAAADSYVYFEPLAGTEAETIPAGQPATLRLPTETGPVAVQVSAFGYVVTEGTLPGEFVYVRLAVANDGDQPVTIDPAGAALTDDLGHRLVGAALYSGSTPLASTTVAPGGRDEVVLGFALTPEAPIETLGSAVVEWPFAYGDTLGMAVAAFLKTGAGPGAAASTEGAAAIASYPSEAFAPMATTAGVPVVLAAPPRTEIITTYVEYEYFTPAVPIWYAPVWRPWRPWRPYAYDYYWSNGWCVPVYEPWSPWRYNDRHSGFFFGFSWFGGHDRDRHDRYDRYDRYDRGGGLSVVAGRDATVFVNQPVTINIASAGPALDRGAVARRVLAGRDRVRDLADRDGRIARLQSPAPLVTAADLRRDVADRREVILSSQARLDERRAATVPG
ncbi:MAG: hypothetical protein IMZ66_11290, partial [Planctomycetes bacterium]|nr:hypothetical protein [Planctomycetota bacterium]